MVINQIKLALARVITRKHSVFHNLVQMLSDSSRKKKKTEIFFLKRKEKCKKHDSEIGKVKKNVKDKKKSEQYLTGRANLTIFFLSFP